MTVRARMSALVRTPWRHGVARLAAEQVSETVPLPEVPFVQVPERIVGDPRVSMEALGLLTLMVWYFGPIGHLPATTSLADLARTAGATVEQIRPLLHCLDRAGYLSPEIGRKAYGLMPGS